MTSAFYVAENEAITASLIADDKKRLQALPQYFGDRHMLRTEMQIYHFLDLLAADYKGGFWNYYSLSNGGFYMAPVSPAELNCVWTDNYFEGRMSADAAGITACLFAINMMANVTFEDRFSELFYQLREYAFSHPEAALIIRAID
ncbi:MAG: antirestriction protein [Gallionella sp.]|nr:antirestriction protein [Gallionella sp.]